MNLKRQQLILMFALVLVIGFGIGYATVTFIDGNDSPSAEGVERSDNGTSGATDLSEAPQDMEKVVQAYELIQDKYLEKTDGTKLIEGAIQGMLDTLGDPYSTYMDIKTMERFNEQIEASFEGIGAEVSMDNGKVTIIAPIKDSPAEKAGIRPNDQITKIDNKALDGLDLIQAVEKIRGKKGTEVVLEINRSGVTKPLEIKIVRDEIPLETVANKMETIDGKKTGIIEINSFSEHTFEDFKKQLSTLESKGMEGLIIDVRGNPGGLLNSVEDMLKMFVTKDIPYLQIEDRSGKKEPFYSDLKEKKDYPISVLVDEGSASASEILAVSLKEAGYDVVGAKSFGKGTVQQAVPLGDGSTIKLTFYKWLSPEGNWINKKGVEPTIKQKQPAYFYANPIQIEEPLTFNHTGEDIKNVQVMLKGIGYDPKRVDGYFNEETEAAIKTFQTDNKLEVSGAVDEKTARAIETKVLEKIRSGKDDQQMKKALETLYK